MFSDTQPRCVPLRGSERGFAPSLSRTLRKGWVMEPSEHPGTRITSGIGRIPSRTRVWNPILQKTKGGQPSAVARSILARQHPEHTSLGSSCGSTRIQLREYSD
jgi:hypothetical protein